MTKAAPETRDAIVTIAYGRRFEVEFANGETATARIKGRKLRPVCGDHVATNPLARESEYTISAIHPRANALARTNSRGQPETLAANIDHVVVVVANLPKPDLFMIDRLLGAANLLNCDVTLAINKIDLSDDDTLPAQFQHLNLAVVGTSAVTGAGLSLLRARLEAQTSVLLGQSGVGKSSLTNALLPHAEQKTADIGITTGEGKHTTVAARRLQLGPNAYLMDSPGMRDFAPYLESEIDVIRVFPELNAVAPNCRFHNCIHFSEPNCAVIALSESSPQLERRYMSYRRLLNIVRQTRRSH